MRCALLPLLLAGLVSLAAAAPEPADPWTAAWAGLAPGAAAQPIDAARVGRLLALAAGRGWNLFDLLNEAGLSLQGRGLRVEVAGADLRAATRTYRMGDVRTDTLLPLAKLRRLTLGAAGPAEAAVVVELTETHSAFLELGDFALATRYGFQALGPRVLDAAFGVTVKVGLLNLPLQAIRRVPDPTGHQDPNFIAIEVQNFFRPKRWHIDPVRTLSAPTP